MDAIKVLMVDDEERMRKLVKDFLCLLYTSDAADE